MLPPQAMVTIKNPMRQRGANLAFALLAAVLLTACAPPGPRAMLRGKDLAEKGRWSEALPELRAAVDLMPTNALAWQYFGVAAHKNGQRTEAEQAYLRALSLNRDLTETRLNLGTLYLDMGRVDDAKTQLTTYNLRTSNSLEGLLKLATAQLRSRDATTAERTFSEALRLSPQSAEAHNGLGLARMQRGRPNEAAQFFATATRESTNYAPAWLNLAVVRHHQLKDPAGALAAYKRYLALDPMASNAPRILAIAQRLSRETTPLIQPAPTVAQPNAPTSPSVAAPGAVHTSNAQTTAPVIETAVAPILTPRISATQQQSVAASPQPGARQQTTAPQVATRAEPSGTELKTRAAPANQARTAPQNGQSRTEPPSPSRATPLTNPAVGSASRATGASDSGVQAQAQPRTVVVTPGPVYRPAQDAGPQGQQRPAQTQAQTQAQAQPQASEAGQTASSLIIMTSSVPSSVASKPKRSFLESINPANFLRGERSGAGSPAPVIRQAVTNGSPVEVSTIPRRPQGQSAAQQASGAAEGSQAARTPQSKAAEARYKYKNEGRPSPGNRQEAERALAQGLQAHGTGKLQAAAQAYRTAAEADPSLFEAHYNLGLATAEAGNLQSALAAYEQALAILPSSFEARYNFALVLRQAGFYTDTAAELQKLVEQYPNDARARLALGQAYATYLKQPAKARVHYLKALELDPGNGQAAAIRSWLVLHPAQ